MRPRARAAALVLAAAGAAVLAASAAAILVAGPDRTARAQGAAWVEVERWPLPPLPVEPLDVALAPDGRLWVADGRNGSVAVYPPERDAPIGRLEPPDAIAALSPTGPGAGAIVPFSLAIDPGRDRLYVLWAEIVPPGDRFREGLTSLYVERRRLDGASLGVALRRGAPLPASAGMVTDLALARDGSLLAYVSGQAERLDAVAGTATAIARVGREGEATRMAVLPGGDLLVASPWSGQLLRYAPSGAMVDAWPIGGPLMPRALAAGDDGAVHVLLGAGEDDAIGPDPTVLLTLDASGATTAGLRASELDIEVPRGGWPLALALAGPDARSGLALVSAGERLVVARRAPAGARWPALAGAASAPGWSPRLGHPDEAFGAGLAFAAVDARRIAVLDHRERQLVSWERPGGIPSARPVPPGTLDVAGGPGSALFAATGAAIVRLDDTASITPTWTVSRTAPAGTRLALGDLLHATDPREGRVEGFDPGSGRALGAARLPAAAGLWPADAAASGSSVFTADRLDRLVHAWDASSPSAPRAAAPSGLAGGPRRLGAGRLADGSPGIAVLLSDGYVELLADGAAGLRTVARFRPEGAERADDIALDDGRVLLADPADGAVRALAPRPGAPSATAAPPPRPTPSDAACAVLGDKRAGPRRVVLGDTAEITLTLSARCPARARVEGADIVLVMDRSGSMAGPKLLASQRAATAFLEPFDGRIHRIALVSFADEAALDAPLGTGLGPLIDALDRLAAEGGTNLSAAMAAASGHLADAGRPSALPAVVLATDGRATTGGDPAGVAAAARAAGIAVYAVGIGVDVDRDALRALSGAPERAFVAARPGDLHAVYDEIQRRIASSLAGNLVIADVPDARLAPIPGSSRPPALEGGGTLGWGRTLLPTDGITMTYVVRPLVTGRIAVGRAVADYVDADGVARRFAFPEPEIEVVAPTASPTRTRAPTPRPTATRTPGPPRPAYLPFASRSGCVAAATRADVVLAIDASQSMAGEKLAAARAAAERFVGLLAFGPGGDRAAIVAFDAEPHVLAPLTGDASGLRAALGTLASRPGTRIDLALRAAAGELAGAGGPGRRRVVVLLSDGAHNGPADGVIALAERLRGEGVWIDAIGLGADADAALLRAVASPGRYVSAPTPEDLVAIYERIAAALPCR